MSYGRACFQVCVSASVVVSVTVAAPRAVSAQGATLLAKAARKCQQTLGKEGQKFEKTFLKEWEKCLDAQLTGKSCDEEKRDLKISKAETAYASKVDKKCTTELLFNLPPDGGGFGQTCNFKPNTPAPLLPPQQCQTITVNDPSSLAACMTCWREAGLLELLKILYPCLQGKVTRGLSLDCGTPPGACPDTKKEKPAIACLKSIAHASSDFLLTQEALLETCLDSVRAGNVTPPCPDSAAQTKLTAAAAKRKAKIDTCAATPAWWNVCPEGASSETSCEQHNSSLTDINVCVGESVDELGLDLICQQYPRAGDEGIACPPEDTRAAPQIDTFPNSIVQITVTSTQGVIDVILVGNSTMQTDVRLAADTDGDGLEQTSSQVVGLAVNSVGNVATNNPAPRLRVRDPTKNPKKRSVGEIEETVNVTPGTLDIPPLTATGGGTSFYDLYLDTGLFHNNDPIRVQGAVTGAPAGEHDILSFTGAVPWVLEDNTQLLNAFVTGLKFVPNAGDCGNGKVDADAGEQCDINGIPCSGGRTCNLDCTCQ